MKKQVEYKTPSQTPSRDRTIPPVSSGALCGAGCPHVIYNRKGSANIYAHCMKYYVPLESEDDPPSTFPIIKRHTSCLNDFPGDNPKSSDPDETRIIKVPKP